MFKLLKNIQFLRYVIFFLLIPGGYLNPTLNWVVILFGPLLVYSHPRKLEKNQNNYLLSLFLFIIIVLLTGIFSVDPQYPLKISLNIFSILLSSYFVSLRLKNRTELLLFLKAVFSATLIYVFILYFVAFDGVTFNFIESETFGKNSSSVIIFVGLTSLLALSLMTNRSKSTTLFSLFFFISIFLTGSIKVILVSAILLFYYFFFKDGFKIKKILFALIIFTLFLFAAEWYINLAGLSSEQSFLRITSRLSVLFGGQSEIGYIDSDYMTGFRLYLIEEGLNLFYQNPWKGIGLENTRLFLGTYTHNNFVEILAGTGIIGFLIYTTGLYIIVKSVFRIPIYNIKAVLLISVFCFILIANAQRIYDNRFLMVFLVSYLPIHKLLINEKK